MGWKFYDPNTAPEVFTIVWCKWPNRWAKLVPGDKVRPTLVLDVRPQTYVPTGEVFADVTLAYGTGAENIPVRDANRDLLIGAQNFRAAGLHKETVFQLDLGNRKRLPWGARYFIPNEYVRSQNIIIGKLSDEQRANVLECFAALKLTFPLP
jgi:hypothetical protein